MTNKAQQFIAEMRNKTNTAVTGYDLIEGQRIWVAGYAFGRGSVPVEMVVVNSHVEKKYKRLQVAYVNKEDQRFHAASYDYEKKASFLYLGDLGVRPHNYDNRVPQVFFTREALEAALKLWGDKNPNFMRV